MARGGSIVRDGRVIRVARMWLSKDGIVQEVGAAWVACGGVQRLVWPPSTKAEGQYTLPEEILASDFARQPCTATAFVRYVAAAGRLEWRFRANNVCPPVVENINQSTIVSPPVASPGLAFLRLTDQPGDDEASGPTGWVDVTEEPEWTLVQGDLGQSRAFATLELGLLDQAGVVQVQATTEVRFTADVQPDPTVSPPGFNPSPDPWALEDVREGEPAFVRVEVGYEQGVGRTRGFENIVLAEDEGYADPASQNELVRLVTSSTELEGSAVNTWLPMSLASEPIRTWELRADEAGVQRSLTAQLEIDDGLGNIVSKDVSMLVQFIDGIPTIPLEPGDALGTLYDRNNINQEGQTPAVTLCVRPDGTITVDLAIQPDPPNPRDTWLLTPDDAAAFEARLVVTWGNADPIYMTGPDRGVWHDLSDELCWSVSAPPPSGLGVGASYNVTADAVFTLEIRQKNKLTNIEVYSGALIADNNVQGLLPPN